MLFSSPVYSQASGSIAGITYSHNAGGMYTRARATPTNPSSAFQNQIRAGLTAAVTAWTALAQADRDSWDLYGANTPTTNRLGATVNRTGQNWFVAAYSVMNQANNKLSAGLPAFTAGPTTFNRGDFTTPELLPIASTGLGLVIEPADAWANEDDAVLLIYQGLPQNASRKYFGGPFRLVAAIAGDSTTPPVAAQTVTSATLAAEGYPITAGQVNSIAAVVLRADGRISTRRLVGPEPVI